MDVARIDSCLVLTLDTVMRIEFSPTKPNTATDSENHKVVQSGRNVWP